MMEVTVTGLTAGFSAGSLLLLDGDQVRRRAHAVDILDPQTLDDLNKKDEKLLASWLEERELVRAKANLEFKRGETIVIMQAGSLQKAALTFIAPADSADALAARKVVADKLRAGEKITAANKAAVEAENNRRKGRQKTGNLISKGKRLMSKVAGGMSGDMPEKVKAGKTATVETDQIDPNKPALI